MPPLMQSHARIGRVPQWSVTRMNLPPACLPRMQLLLLGLLGLGGCMLMRPDVDQVHIVATPYFAACGERAHDMVVDLEIRNASPGTLRFHVRDDMRHPPVLPPEYYDVSLDGDPIERLGTPLPLPALMSPDVASISGHDSGHVFALLGDVRPGDYTKVMRITLHGWHERRVYKSAPFVLCPAGKMRPQGKQLPDVHDRLPLTTRSARLLPVHDLARVLLGSEGANVIDVQRPGYKDQLQRVRLFERAETAPTEHALCRSRWTDVTFDDKGHIASRTATWHYGAPDHLYDTSTRSTHGKDAARCKKLDDTRDFFPAPDARAAAQVARYVDVFNWRGPFAHQSVSGHWTTGHKRWPFFLPHGPLKDIDSVTRIPCLPNHSDENACFSISDNDGGRQYRVYGLNTPERVRIDQIVGEVELNMASRRMPHAPVTQDIPQRLMGML